MFGTDNLAEDLEQIGGKEKAVEGFSEQPDLAKLLLEVLDRSEEGPMTMAEAEEIGKEVLGLTYQDFPSILEEDPELGEVLLGKMRQDHREELQGFVPEEKETWEQWHKRTGIEGPPNPKYKPENIKLLREILEEALRNSES